MGKHSHPASDLFASRPQALLARTLSGEHSLRPGSPNSRRPSKWRGTPAIQACPSMTLVLSVPKPIEDLRNS